MQKLSVGLARSIWLFDIYELNPTGRSILPDLFIWLGEKYSFQKFPRSEAEIDPEKKGYLFQTGTFQVGDESITVNFSLYSDGLVAETWASTEKSDAFLEEILRYATNKFNLAFTPEMIRVKQYVSEINVRLDYPLSNINPKLVSFCEMMTGLFKRHNLPKFEMTGILFAPDVSTTSYKPPGLTIERKINTPFSENRFWSKAPFTTNDHLFALEEFEKFLAG